ncbi:uncharacterized protein [Battus philenor]|uniref:uncharacterized protein n=1 Tax=Battus philenor TaxID=42288 RepID=UPI0035CF0F05
MSNANQIKITKLFRKGRAIDIPEGNKELQDEIQMLQEKLNKKHTELFKIQQKKYRIKLTISKKKPVPFVKPEKIIIENSIATLKKNIELMSMISGMEVEEYDLGDFCSIMYHTQHDSKHVIKHRLKINMASGKNVVSMCTYPIGFNYKEIIDGYDDVMMPACLWSLKKGLLANYNRLHQIQALEKLVGFKGEIFKKFDNTHVTITFEAETNRDDEEEDIKIVLVLDYRVYDVRPKTFGFNNCDLPEDDINVLKTQCAVFKKKPLCEAFKQAFMDGIGPFSLKEQNRPGEETGTRRRKPVRPNNNNYNIDDTFIPEESTDQSGNDDQ